MFKLKGSLVANSYFSKIKGSYGGKFSPVYIYYLSCDILEGRNKLVGYFLNTKDTAVKKDYVAEINDTDAIQI